MTATTSPAATAFARSCLARCGVVGCRDTKTELARRITRLRPRGSGSKSQLADRLAEKLDELAARRWQWACKGQRRPTVKQVAGLAADITAALAAVQGRCRERTLTVQDVIRTARIADSNGAARDDGGKVTASSYGYRWTTTTVYATRQPDGTVRVAVSRDGKREITAPARWWRDVTTDSTILQGGGAFGVRRADGGWDVYDADSRRVGVAVPMPTDLRSRFGWWEHGTDAAACGREIDHKRAIVAAEAAKTAADAKAARRTARMATLLCRIGNNTPVTYADARACGMCDAGIRVFAAKLGIADMTGAVPLTDVARLEPTYAVKLARLVLGRRAAVAC